MPVRVNTIIITDEVYCYNIPLILIQVNFELNLKVYNFNNCFLSPVLIKIHLENYRNRISDNIQLETLNKRSV